MEEDSRAIERILQGDTGAFDQLAGKYQKEIYYLALRMLKNEEDAEEVAQQALMNAFSSLKQFRGGASFRTWLYRITINLANTNRRRAARRGAGAEFHDNIASETPQALDRLIISESERETVKMLDALGEKQKMTVILRIFQELPYDEIGRIIGCTEQTAKVHFHYGMENLRKKMKKNGL
jgi:RNA polymerase sigma-70 factor, ECF subfamily